ncbi:MAG: hypothetical protein ACR2NV_13185 [Thermoleophilaceae bacterium]
MSVVGDREVEDRGVGRVVASGLLLLLAALCVVAWAAALYSRSRLGTPGLTWELTLLVAIAMLDLAAPAWLLLGAFTMRSRYARVISRLRPARDSWVEHALGVAALAGAGYVGVTLAVRFQTLLEPLRFPSLGAAWTVGLTLASLTVVVTATTSLVVFWRLVQRSITGSPVDNALRRLWAVRGSSAALAAIVALTVASSGLILEPGENELSHYVLIRALADGTPRIDRYERESMDKSERETVDISFYAGHFYSNKAPGLAFLGLPMYKLLEATGIRPVVELASGRNAVIRILSVWAVTLPAALLLLLVRHFANRAAPGFGTAAAVTLGLGTLMLPYSLMLYTHVLAASLAFGAFALLWLERDRVPSVALVGAGGTLAGLAVTTEYALALAGVVLGVYAISRNRNWIRRGLAYSTGAVLGVVPLLLYNAWAFGSITHLSYSDALAPPGEAGQDVIGFHDVGFFGVGVPDPGVAVDVLFSPRGLLVCTPVLVAGLIGIGGMYRRGWRAEAAVVASIALLFLAYNSAYQLDPFGGNAPGPRFLVAVLPFIAVPLAVAYERFTAVTLSLAVASVTLMVIVSVTGPYSMGEGPNPGVWLRSLTSGTFQGTVLGEVGAGRGWASLAPSALLVAAAIFFAARATDWSGLSGGLKSGVAALIAWGAVALLAQVANTGDVIGALLLIGLCFATALIALAPAVWVSSRRRAT